MNKDDRTITMEMIDKAIENSEFKLEDFHNWDANKTMDDWNDLLNAKQKNQQPDDCVDAVSYAIESFDRYCKPLTRWERFKHWFKRKTNKIFHWYEIIGWDVK